MFWSFLYIKNTFYSITRIQSNVRVIERRNHLSSSQVRRYWGKRWRASIFCTACVFKQRPSFSEKHAITPITPRVRRCLFFLFPGRSISGPSGPRERGAPSLLGPSHRVRLVRKGDDTACSLPFTPRYPTARRKPWNPSACCRGDVYRLDTRSRRDSAAIFSICYARVRAARADHLSLAWFARLFHFFSFRAWSRLPRAFTSLIQIFFKGSLSEELETSSLEVGGLSEITTCSHFLSLEIQVQTPSRTATRLSHYVVEVFVIVRTKGRGLLFFGNFFPRTNYEISKSRCQSVKPFTYSVIRKLQVHFNHALFILNCCSTALCQSVRVFTPKWFSPETRVFTTELHRWDICVATAVWRSDTAFSRVSLSRNVHSRARAGNEEGRGEEELYIRRSARQKQRSALNLARAGGDYASLGAKMRWDKEEGGERERPRAEGNNRAENSKLPAR